LAECRESESHIIRYFMYMKLVNSAHAGVDYWDICSAAHSKLMCNYGKVVVWMGAACLQSVAEVGRSLAGFSQNGRFCEVDSC